MRVDPGSIASIERPLKNGTRWLRAFAGSRQPSRPSPPHVLHVVDVALGGGLEVDPFGTERRGAFALDQPPQFAPGLFAGQTLGGV